MPHNDDVENISGMDAENSRRTALKQMASLCGLFLSTQALDVLATTPTTDAAPIAKFLTSEQLRQTGIIAEIIIPATQTPGALAVNVHGFIDRYLATCVSKAEQQLFVDGLQQINTISVAQFHQAFLSAKPPQQVQLLHWIEAAQSGFTSRDSEFFRLFKSLTVMGYYTSEIGATQELAFVPIPGGYKGEFPFSKVGKAWSLNGI